MSSPIQKIVDELVEALVSIDSNVNIMLYDTWVKNTLLIGIALYCIFAVKKTPTYILELTNKVWFRIAVAVLIVYTSRRHIDLAILMVLAFYFALREARGIRVRENGDLEVLQEEDSTEREVEEVKDNMPFQQAKNPSDETHPAHIQEDMAVYDSDNMNTCVAVDERDMCAGGLFNPMGYVADDFNNLADF